MIPIRPADDELFATMLAAARLGRLRPSVDSLRSRYDQEWDDPLAGLPYALAMLAGMLSGREDSIEETSYVEIVETLSDVLYHLPDHWLGRYLRIHARAILPDDSDQPKYVAAERTRAIEDARELIERQDRADWQPWFACSYLLAARLTWHADRDAGYAVAVLVTTAAARRCTPVRFPALGSVMCSAFRWYRDQPGLPEQDAVGSMMAALFPDQPAVRQAQAGQAA
jgi:hypothetical protein